MTLLIIMTRALKKGGDVSRDKVVGEEERVVSWGIRATGAKSCHCQVIERRRGVGSEAGRG
jgi:hypothetical protein